MGRTVKFRKPGLFGKIGSGSMGEGSVIATFELNDTQVMQLWAWASSLFSSFDGFGGEYPMGLEIGQLHVDPMQTVEEPITGKVYLLAQKDNQQLRLLTPLSVSETWLPHISVYQDETILMSFSIEINGMWSIALWGRYTALSEGIVKLLTKSEQPKKPFKQAQRRRRI
jgi:hypothetical protein